MAPTMRDVASRAGVSVKSVSRVVNDHPNISQDVRGRVRRAIEELGWSPNADARTLRTGRTGRLAVSLPDLTAPSAARMAQALVSEVERLGLGVAIEPSRGRPERVAQTLAALGSSFDGVIHLGPLDPGPALAAGAPLVAVHTGWDPEAAAARGFDTVDPDEAEAAARVGHHLRTLGCVRPVLLAHREGQPDAYADALRAGLPGLRVLRTPGPSDRSTGRELAARALAEHPEADALVGADDELALGALSLLRERGLDVPGRWPVIGHGDLDDTRFTTPSLSTVDPGVAETARRAVDRVRRRLDGDRAPARHELVPVRLRRRESTLGRTAAAWAGEEASPWAG